MSSLQELHSAQVRTRARNRAFIYTKLQQLIKSRTKAGYIHGVYDESPIPVEEFSGEINMRIDSPIIKVTARTMTYPPRGNSRIVIHFYTKR